jgi:hypothetical protein
MISTVISLWKWNDDETLSSPHSAIAVPILHGLRPATSHIFLPTGTNPPSETVLASSALLLLPVPAGSNSVCATRRKKSIASKARAGHELIALLLCVYVVLRLLMIHSSELVA